MSKPKGAVFDVIYDWAKQKAGFNKAVDIDAMTEEQFQAYSHAYDSHPALDSPELDALIDLSECYSNYGWAEAMVYRLRWPEGMDCYQCGSQKVREDKREMGNLWRCRNCNTAWSLTSHTALHRTQIGLDYWIAIVVLFGRDVHEVSSLLIFSTDDVKAAYEKIEQSVNAVQQQSPVSILQGLLAPRS